jgi:hypothetical protein
MMDLEKQRACGQITFTIDGIDNTLSELEQDPPFLQAHSVGRLVRAVQALAKVVALQQDLIKDLQEQIDGKQSLPGKQYE